MAQQNPPPISVRIIDADQTHTLRQAVLRPHQQLSEMLYDGDDLPGTVHLGAFTPSQPQSGSVGIVSLWAEPMPGDCSPSDWRLRGMAVAPKWQGTGVGRLLIRSAIETVGRHGGTRLWCNARVSVMGFYEKSGFARHGEPFEISGIGPHYVMSIAAPDHSR